MHAGWSYEKGIALQVSLLFPCLKVLCSLNLALVGRAASSPVFSQRKRQLSPALGTRTLIPAVNSAVRTGKGGGNAAFSGSFGATNYMGGVSETSLRKERPSEAGGKAVQGCVIAPGCTRQQRIKHSNPADGCGIQAPLAGWGPRWDTCSTITRELALCGAAPFEWAETNSCVSKSRGIPITTAS